MCSCFNGVVILKKPNMSREAEIFRADLGLGRIRAVDGMSPYSFTVCVERERRACRLGIKITPESTAVMFSKVKWTIASETKVAPGSPGFPSNAFPRVLARTLEMMLSIIGP